MKKLISKTLAILFVFVLSCSTLFFTASAENQTGVYDGVVDLQIYDDGDVNGDRSVNLLDLVRLKKYFANTNVSITRPYSDINGDNKITSSDLVGLVNYLLDL